MERRDSEEGRVGEKREKGEGSDIRFNVSFSLLSVYFGWRVMVKRI